MKVYVLHVHVATITSLNTLHDVHVAKGVKAHNFLVGIIHAVIVYIVWVA